MTLKSGSCLIFHQKLRIKGRPTNHSKMKVWLRMSIRNNCGNPQWTFACCPPPHPHHYRAAHTHFLASWVSLLGVYLGQRSVQTSGRIAVTRSLTTFPLNQVNATNISILQDASGLLAVSHCVGALVCHFPQACPPVRCPQYSHVRGPIQTGVCLNA